MASGHELQLLFLVSVILGFTVWGIVAARYIWPALRARSRRAALRPILMLHSFRFIGLSFIIPGVVSPDLPAAFARPAAYADLSAAILALLALATLESRIGVVLVWIFNIVGTTDLLAAYYNGNRTGVGLAPGLQGADFLVTTVLVPLLVVTPLFVFRILLRNHDGGNQ